MRGRTRSIKPETFTDEDLWDLGVETGLPILQGFEGLWCYSDRAGRFEWRPRTLKPFILPYWDGDFSRVLDALSTRGFVVRYACGTREYGVVRNFRKHQTPNNRENASELPEPPEDSARVSHASSTREPRVSDASSTREAPATIRNKLLGSGILDPGSWESERGRGRARACDRGSVLAASQSPAEKQPPPPSSPNGPSESETPSETESRTPALTPDSMADLFAKTFLTLRQTAPKMNGKGVDELHQRVLETAEARGVDPRGLFVSTVHRWLTVGELKPRELGAPYACFAAAWSELVDRTNGQAPPSRTTVLLRKRLAAMDAHDDVALAKIDAEYSELNGKHHAD